VIVSYEGYGVEYQGLRIEEYVCMCQVPFYRALESPDAIRIQKVRNRQLIIRSQIGFANPQLGTNSATRPITSIETFVTAQMCCHKHVSTVHLAFQGASNNSSRVQIVLFHQPLNTHLSNLICHSHSMTIRQKRRNTHIRHSQSHQMLNSKVCVHDS
jgi:hypothetical protein